MNGPGAVVAAPVPDETSTKGPDMTQGTRAKQGTLMTWLRNAASVETNECLEFPFHRTAAGYGRVNFQGWQQQATHVVLFLVGQPRPPAPHDRALHSCDKPPCCNPRHLRWGTPADNVTDSIERNRWSRGERQTNRTLNDAQVLDIRCRDYSVRGSKAAVAAEFGICRSNITAILGRRSWTHI